MSRVARFGGSRIRPRFFHAKIFWGRRIRTTPFHARVHGDTPRSQSVAESVFCGSAFEKLSIRAQSQLSPYCLLQAESPERSSMRAGRRRGRSTNDSALLDGSDVPTGKYAHEVTITARCDARWCVLKLPRFGFRSRCPRRAARLRRCVRIYARRRAFRPGVDFARPGAKLAACGWRAARRSRRAHGTISSRRTQGQRDAAGSAGSAHGSASRVRAPISPALGNPEVRARLPRHRGGQRLPRQKMREKERATKMQRHGTRIEVPPAACHVAVCIFRRGRGALPRA